MKSPALIVPRERGEELRRRLAEADLLRRDLRIRAEGNTLVLPVRDRTPELAEWGTVEDREFDPYPARDTAEEYRDLIPEGVVAPELLPRSFDVVGDVVLIRLPPELESAAAAIGEALLRFVPGARLVGVDRGVHGMERTRRLERIAGSGPWTTRHRENGIDLDVDLERAYFSPRLAREHARVSDEVRAGERVYDLCCGVGPFAVAIARDGRAREVVAVDSNPEAIRLLRSTLARHAFGLRVRPVAESLEEFLPSAGPADRAILNLPLEGIKYLSSVARIVAPGGVLHFYEVTPRNHRQEHAEELVAQSLGPGWESRAPRSVHPYSPVSDLVAYSFRRRDA